MMKVFQKIADIWARSMGAQSPQDRESLHDGLPDEVDTNKKDFTYYSHPEPRRIPVSTFDEATLRETVCDVMKLDPPENCGFDFANVYVEKERHIDRDTGELFKETTDVLLSGTNLKKVIRDISEIGIVVDYFMDSADRQWIPVSFFDDYLMSFSAPGQYGTVNLEASISIEPLTKTYRPKKYPVIAEVSIYDRSNFKTSLIANTDGSTRLNETDRGNENLLVRMQYLKDGTVGKARFIVWRNHRGMMVNIDKTKDSDYQVSSYKVCTPKSTSGWTTRYSADK